MAEPPSAEAPPPAPAPSWVVRVLWWSLVAAPVINLPFSILGGVLRSTDFALAGALFFAVPLGLVSLVTTLMTLLKAVADGTLAARQRLAIAALALSTIPTYYLVGATVYVFGELAFQWPLGSFGCVIGTAGLVWFFRRIRPLVWTVAAERWSP